MIVPQIKFDYQNKVTYIGQTRNDATDNEPVWEITKLTYDDNGRVLRIARAGGLKRNIYKWSDRANLEYGE